MSSTFWKKVVKNKNGILITEKLAVKPIINGDEVHITNVVFNLLDNAAKYSKDKKYIEMKTAEERSTVFVEIIDKGIGIQKEDQKRIFEKFERC